jgi:EF hand
LNVFLDNLKGICMRTRTITAPPYEHDVATVKWCSVIFLALVVMAVGSATHAQSIPSASMGSTPHTAPTQMAPMAAADMQANRAPRMDIDAAFNRADVNRDGKLSRTEAEHFPAVAQRFEQIDSNHDGFISREEFMQVANN